MRQMLFLQKRLGYHQKRMICVKDKSFFSEFLEAIVVLGISQKTFP
jgi:hypothetical protein